MITTKKPSVPMIGWTIAPRTSMSSGANSNLRSFSFKPQEKSFFNKMERQLGNCLKSLTKIKLIISYKMPLIFSTTKMKLLFTLLTMLKNCSGINLMDFTLKKLILKLATLKNKEKGIRRIYSQMECLQASKWWRDKLK